MITVDGNKSDLSIKNFENLEQILVKVLEDESFADRVVTDVVVNNEAFSEIYPHQAEDIESGSIESIEIRTMGSGEMARNIVGELGKVVKIMNEGARSIADLFRQADDAEALEMYQDLLDVTRDFLGMVGTLREEFSVKEMPVLAEAVTEISNLFGEMVEVTENEDWILLADLLEYEFVPAVLRWEEVVEALRNELREAGN